MIKAAIQGTLAILVGLALAFAGVIGVELLSSILHPVPPGTDPSDLDACRAHVARYPTLVLLLCAMGWWATVFCSCWLATRCGVGRHAFHGWIVGGLLLALATFNMALLPYPAWFWVNVVLFPASCLLGTRLARPPAAVAATVSPNH